VKVLPQAGVPVPEADDTVSELFAGLTLDTLDDLMWPRAGARLAAAAEWNLAGMGATHAYWRLRVEGRRGRALGERGALQLDALAGLSGQDLPGYDYFRVGGPMLIPGYRFEELKGAQALAGALSLRYKAFGPLQLVARGGVGNVFAETSDITLADPRWGLGAGVYYPSRFGPISLEVGFRDGGRHLVSLAVGWH
jgi:outer membrane protein assembly factor BamA